MAGGGVLDFDDLVKAVLERNDIWDGTAGVIRDRRASLELG